MNHHVSFRILALLLWAACGVALPALSSAQVTQDWVARYNRPPANNDYARSIAVDGQGNVYVTGHSGLSEQDQDYVTVKYNAAGVEQWVAIYDNGGIDVAVKVALDDSGNVYVSGHSDSAAGGDADYATIKYSPAGAELWVERYNGSGGLGDDARDMAVDADGNVYVTGWSAGGPPDYNFDIATIKYLTNGDVAWVERYNGLADDLDGGYALTRDDDGNVYVAGISMADSIYLDLIVLKYNSAGSLLWDVRYLEPDVIWSDVSDLVADDQGNVYVSGSSASTSTFNYNYATLKFNSAAQQQWAAFYDGPGGSFDYGNALVLDSGGDVVVTGLSTSSAPNYSTDYATIKYNSATGAQVWAQRYDGPANGNDGAWAIVADQNGNSYITGTSWGGDNDDYVTIKYDAQGNVVWNMRYNAAAGDDDWGTDLAIDDDGYVYVTGQSAGETTEIDYATIKYNQSTGVETLPSDRPLDRFALLSAFPNPFNPSTVLSFELRAASYVKLEVFDLQGRAVGARHASPLPSGSGATPTMYPAGTHQISFDGSGLPSGIYLARLTAGDYSAVQKLVLLK